MGRVPWGQLAIGGALIGTAAVVFFGGEKKAGATPERAREQGSPASYPSGVPMSATGYTYANFQPILHRMIAGDLAAGIAPLYPRVREDFAKAWGDMESGWNPCSVGNPGQLGPDGQPAEIGLGQLYNPDDFRAFGQTPANYRAYAPAAAPLAAQYNQAKADRDAAKARGDAAGQADGQARMNAAARAMQTPTRALSDAEMAAQVRWTLLAKIDQGVKNADRVVATYSLAHWSVPDYWKLVKAPHALPAILGNGMPAVVKKLGRAPASWAEFRQVLGMDHNQQWDNALNACEKCGDAVATAVA